MWWRWRGIRRMKLKGDEEEKMVKLEEVQEKENMEMKSEKDKEH